MCTTSLVFRLSCFTSMSLKQRQSASLRLSVCYHAVSCISKWPSSGDVEPCQHLKLEASIDQPLIVAMRAQQEECHGAHTVHAIQVVFEVVVI